MSSLVAAFVASIRNPVNAVERSSRCGSFAQKKDFKNHTITHQPAFKIFIEAQHYYQLPQEMGRFHPAVPLKMTTQKRASITFMLLKCQEAVELRNKHSAAPTHGKLTKYVYLGVSSLMSRAYATCNMNNQIQFDEPSSHWMEAHHRLW